MSEEQSCGNGRFIRDPRGVWRYGEDGQPVSGAQDMTLTNFFNFPVEQRPAGAVVLVSRGIALENESLAFCLEHDPGPGTTTIPVPLEVWQRHDRVIGIWAPELKDEGGIRGMKFDELSHFRESEWESPVAPTKPHDIRNMAASLKRNLRRKGWAPQELEGFTAYWEPWRENPREAGPRYLPDAD